MLLLLLLLLSHFNCVRLCATPEMAKTKHKERILKAAREKQQVTYKGNPIRLTAHLSAETLQARREWQDIFKVPKGKNLQPRLLYSAKTSFTIDAEIKSFSQKQKRIQYHQTSFTTNVKGIYIVKKYNRRHIYTESEKMEKYIPCKWEAKERWSSNPVIRQNRP